MLCNPAMEEERMTCSLSRSEPPLRPVEEVGEQVAKAHTRAAAVLAAPKEVMATEPISLAPFLCHGKKNRLPLARTVLAARRWREGPRQTTAWPGKLALAEWQPDGV